MLDRKPLRAGLGEVFALSASDSAVGRFFSMKYCCPICHPFDVVQYRTRPAGKKNPNTPNISGITFRMACCCPEAAPGGLACCICRCWRKVVPNIRRAKA
jgi:hypothetical protein